MSEKVEKKRGRKPIEYKQPIVQKTFRMLEADVAPVTKLVVNYMKKNSNIAKYKKQRKKK
jgi:hypothetical protein